MTIGGISFRFFILGLLNQQPMSGYDIKRLLERLGWLIGSSSFGNIYPTLHALLEDELVTVDVVTSQDRPSKKVYDVSEKGRRVLGEWLEQPAPENASLRAFVMRLILARDLSQDGLVAHLRQRRAQVGTERDVLKEMCNESNQAGVGWQLALDYGLAVADTELEWLESALGQSLDEPPSERVIEIARVAGTS
jgi:DNA-binding PadR family transcriptional regulator